MAIVEEDKARSYILYERNILRLRVYHGPSYDVCLKISSKKVYTLFKRHRKLFCEAFLQ